MNNCPDFCPIPEVKVDIQELKSDIKELMKTNANVNVLVAELTGLREELKEMKVVTTKQTDILFDRVRFLETSYVSKSDIKTFGVILSIIFTVINIILFIVMRITGH